ncbi:MAG: hypothetical protein KatS3mg091_701 [Patescibacteria group bacterium]|nr:MAG: hypothetical protein KatS3mg090_0995 [Patescibacteria group bacterium]GIW63899.1 MAG: hypothetical protein KatS3mg091_701 [Patescibacteria group bacterium]
MKRFVIVLVIGFFYTVLLVSKIYAGYFSFEQQNLTVGVGESFSVIVKIDTENTEVVGAEALIDYDNVKLSVNSISNLNFFDEFSYDIIDQGIYITGSFVDIQQTKSGSGQFAKITFTAEEPGTVTLEFICDPNILESSSIFDSNTEETIVCSSNQTAEITITGDSGSSDNNQTNTGSDTGNITKGGVEESSTVTQLPKSGSVNLSVFYMMLGLLASGLAVGLRNLLK